MVRILKKRPGDAFDAAQRQTTTALVMTPRMPLAPHPRRPSRLPLALLALVLPATAAGAGEYRFTLDGFLGAWGYSNYYQLDLENPQNRTLGGAGLTLGLDYRTPRSETTLDYTPTFRESLEGPGVSSWAHALAFGWEVRPTARTTWNVSERLLYSDHYELDALSDPNVDLVARRSDQLSNRVTVDVAHDLTRRALLLGGVDHRARLYDDDVLYDGQSLGAHAGFGYRLTAAREWRFLVEGRRFDVQAFDDTADEVGFTVGYRADVGRRGSIDLSAGGQRVDAPVRLPGLGEDGAPLPVDGRETYDGWHAAGAANWNGERVDLGVDAAHAVGSGSGLGRPVLVDSAGASVAFKLADPLRLTLDGRGTRSELLATGDLVNEFVVGSAALHWSVLPWLGLTGGYSLVRQTSHVAELPSLTDHRWFANVSFRVVERGEHAIREEHP